jgi:hypothetical protein
MTMPKSKDIRALAEAEGITFYAAEARLRRSTPEGRERDRVTARRWKANNREHNRARDRAYYAREDKRGTCQTCGNSMGIGIDRDGICQSCRNKAKLVVWADLERRWAAGHTIKQITADLGWTKGHLAVEMARMRDAGRNLPYRYRNTKRQRRAVSQSNLP